MKQQDQPERLRLCAIASILAVSAVSIGLPGKNAWGQDYPTRPVQMTVPLPPGTAPDTLARSMAQGLDKAFGQRVLVLNREGGGLTIGMAAVAAAPPDGYSLAFTPVTPITIQLQRMKNLAYTRDTFTPVCQAFDQVFFVAVGPGSPFKDFRSLADHAKANPGMLRYGHSGIASSPHLAGAELWQRAGVQLIDVPYRGEISFAPHLLKGELDIGIASTSLVATQKFRPLAVLAAQRSNRYPDVPTVGELGLPVTFSGYGGIFIRSDAPAPVVSKLEAACREVVGSTAYRDVAEKLFQAATFLGREAFAARIKADSEAKAKLLSTLKLSE